MNLEEIKKWAFDIQSSWNGDESGRQEERADIAGDIQKAIVNLEELIEELNKL